MESFAVVNMADSTSAAVHVNYKAFRVVQYRASWDST